HRIPGLRATVFYQYPQCSFFYYTGKILEKPSPILPVEMGDSQRLFRYFSYSNIYCFRLFRFLTFSFRMASEVWLFTVFTEIFRCSAVSWVVQLRAASIAIANSVVVRSSATSWPVIGL